MNNYYIRRVGAPLLATAFLFISLSAQAWNPFKADEPPVKTVSVSHEEEAQIRASIVSKRDGIVTFKVYNPLTRDIICSAVRLYEGKRAYDVNFNNSFSLDPDVGGGYLTSHAVTFHKVRAYDSGRVTGASLLDCVCLVNKDSPSSCK